MVMEHLGSDRIFKDAPGLRDVLSRTAYEDVRSLVFLHYLVELIKPDVVLELGTGHGCSTAFMALAMGDGKVVSIDNYERADINSPDVVMRNLKLCGVPDVVVLVKGSTFETGELVRKKLGEGMLAKIVFMDSSHTDVNLRREYDSIRDVLPKEHVIVVDDAFANDVPDFVLHLMREEAYNSCVLLPYHQGLAVLVMGDRCLQHVVSSVARCNQGDQVR